MEIKFDKRNYRKHNDKNKTLINKSLEECGAGRSILIDNEGEIWKDIKDFEGYYQISTKGNVRSLDRFIFCKSKEKPNRIKGCTLKPMQDKYGYLIVNLKKNQKSHIRKIHRLVAEAFVKNFYGFETVNHKNGIKTDNNIVNIEWMSSGDNSRHRTANLLTKPKLKKEDIIDVLKNCKPAKNKSDNEKSITGFAVKYNVSRVTISDILKGKKLYLEAMLCR